MSAISANYLIGHRFEAIERVGSGGMGTVHRARDIQTNEWVALKLLNADQPDAAEMERFVREAEVLASLHHPGIVGYVGHGSTPDGQPFLAMEWLEGEDLAHRLRRGPLAVADVVSLLTQVSAALDMAHRAGIVHRDLKPSNLFLRGGQFDRVAILDFGIAQYAKISQRMTRTGSIIGTPDYMAPEQARGERDLGPAADIFSLGCVAYECLVGEPPFAAMHVAATLAKILFAEPEPLNHRTKDVPMGLEKLIMAMLVKEPSERPANVAHALRQLSHIDVFPKPTTGTMDSPPLRIGLAANEQHLFCVIVVTPQQSLAIANTLAADEAPRSTKDLVALRHSLAKYDAQLEALADGSLVVSLGQGNGEATEQVARAVQCAQQLREQHPHSDVVLATGRGIGRVGVPVGEAIDRAGRLLREHNGRSGPRAPDAIILDEVSASLLRSGHRLERRGGVIELRGESGTNDPSRPVLGQPTPCVGREADFSLLEGALDACVEDEMARAILVTGTPGLANRVCAMNFCAALGCVEWIFKCGRVRAIRSARVHPTAL